MANLQLMSVEKKSKDNYNIHINLKSKNNGKREQKEQCYKKQITKVFSLVENPRIVSSHTLVSILNKLQFFSEIFLKISIFSCWGKSDEITSNNFVSSYKSYWAKIDAFNIHDLLI